MTISPMIKTKDVHYGNPAVNLRTRTTPLHIFSLRLPHSQAQQPSAINLFQGILALNADVNASFNSWPLLHLLKWQKDLVVLPLGTRTVSDFDRLSHHCHKYRQQLNVWLWYDYFWSKTDLTPCWHRQTSKEFKIQDIKSIKPTFLFYPYLCIYLCIFVKSLNYSHGSIPPFWQYTQPLGEFLILIWIFFSHFVSSCLSQSKNCWVQKYLDNFASIQLCNGFETHHWRCDWSADFPL